MQDAAMRIDGCPRAGLAGEKEGLGGKIGVPRLVFCRRLVFSGGRGQAGADEGNAQREGMACRRDRRGPGVKPLH